ncbi:MAG: RNA methyltransferase [Oxalobacteraceae bacterium]|jgi:TrmH family RNA methyltransferase|nr:RNA methyltransferase [Oxalobacteraceae bacterium]
MSLRSIQSRDNAQYKQLRQWASSAQARRKSGMTLLDGVHLCEAWLQHRGVPDLCVVAESALSHPEVAALVAQCESNANSNAKSNSNTNSYAGAAECVLLPDALFTPLGQVEHGVGILFAVKVPDAASSGHASPSLQSAALLLDSVQDPGNLGTILRTAAAAGIQEIYCGPGTAAAWSPKVLRAGMGAHFVLEITEDVDLVQLIQQASVPVYATQLDAAKTIYTADLRAPSAWLFGHEGQGVSEQLLALATERLTIPQSSQVESLNVAASVAICLFEQRRQQANQ